MNKPKSTEEISKMDPTTMLDPDAPLFNALRVDLPNLPKWWSTLVSDPEIYIEIRKGNIIHVYYYGARIAEIDYKNQSFSAKCHKKYIDGDNAADNEYASCILLLENNIDQLKTNALKFYVKDTEGKDTSENRIKGRLRIDNLHRYIDSEFEHSYDCNNLIRFDLVAIEGNKLKVEELKRIGDSRLRTSNTEKKRPEVLYQMEKYSKFMNVNQVALCVYYQTLLKIKAKLGLPMPIGYDSEKALTLDLTPVLLIKNLYDYSKMCKKRFKRIKDIRDILETNKIKYYFLP